VQLLNTAWVQLPVWHEIICRKIHFLDTENKVSDVLYQSMINDWWLLLIHKHLIIVFTDDLPTDSNTLRVSK